MPLAYWQQADAGRPADRVGGGVLIEVDPAAALRVWGLTSRSYKESGNRATLGELVDQLQAALPVLDWQGHEDVCRSSDDALDAVVCSLLARAAHLGLTGGPPEGLAARAATEGWIHVPVVGSLSLLGH